MIGIFWLYKDVVLGRAVEVSDGEESVPGMVDSPDNHSAFWEEEKNIAKIFPELRDCEYFAVPRGRVLYSQQDGLWIVYMDKTLFGEKTKSLSRKFFNLDETRTIWRTDLHYSTSTEDLDRLLG